MAQAEPATLNESVLISLNQFSAATTHTDKYDKFVFKRILNECDRLQKIDVVCGSLNKAFLCSTIGDFSEAERWLKNAEQNNGKDLARIELFTHLVNHGYATQGLAIIDQTFAARMTNNLMELAAKAAAIGSFNKIVDAVAAATAKGEVLQMTNIHALALKATEVMRLLQVSDDDVAAMLDVAGECLRDNKLLWQTELPDITVLDASHGGPSLGIEYRIDLTPKQAVQLGWSVSEQLVERGLDRAGVYVGFLGTAIQRQLAA